MQKECRFTVDLGKAVLSTAVCAFLFLITGIMLTKARFGSAAVFAILAVPFVWEAVRNFAQVGFDNEGVYELFFGKCVRRMPWDAVQEAGVCGTKVFHKKNSKKTGRLYLYFSSDLLDDQKRFDMILKWPPRKQIYLQYMYDRVEALRRVWDGKLELYNEGDLDL